MNDYNVCQQGNDLQTIQIINRINIAKAFYDRLSITVYMNFKIIWLINSQRSWITSILIWHWTQLHVFKYVRSILNETNVANILLDLIKNVIICLKVKKWRLGLWKISPGLALHKQPDPLLYQSSALAQYNRHVALRYSVPCLLLQCISISGKLTCPTFPKRFLLSLLQALR